MPLDGFSIGDYVIADHAEFDNYDDVTWRITGFSANSFGRTLVHVLDIAHPESVKTVFYPRELSFEDGTRPTAAHNVNRGSW